MIQLITKNSIRQARDTDILFDWLYEITTEIEAIEASSWAEIACIDEEYEGTCFKLRII